MTPPVAWAGLAEEALRRCDVLGRLSEEQHRLTRTFLSPPMHAVQEHLGAWMTDAGMTVRQDAAGNVVGRYAARDEPAPVFLLGSHVDTVPGAGKYDGVLGVALCIAAVGVLHRLGGARFPFALEVLAFAEEEGARYGVPFLGSRAVVGQYDAALLALRDANGVSVEEAIRAFGNDPAALPRAAYDAGMVLGYLEPHIEQGPVLEGLGRPLGVVSAIASQSRLTATFAGRAGHAGTTPMAARRDALCGAADFILAAEREALAVPQLVATVGQLAVLPGGANVIPGEVALSLDVRHPDDGARRQAVTRLLDQGATLAARRGLTLSARLDFEQDAVRCDDHLSSLLAESLLGLGLPAPRVVSGAGHDAMVLAQIAPVAMLFLRSPGGISHHPDERLVPGDVALTIQTLVAFLRRRGAVATGGRDERVSERKRGDERGGEGGAVEFADV